MDNRGEAARPTTVESIGLGMMAIAVEEGEAYMGTGIFHGLLGAAAAGRVSVEPTAAAYHNYAVSAPPPAAQCLSPCSAVNPAPAVYANVGASWPWQPGPADAVLVGLQLPRRVVVPVRDSYFCSALQPRPGAGPGVVLAALRPGGVGAVYSGDYALQPRPGAEHGEVHVDLLPDDAGHGEAFFGHHLPGRGIAAYDGYGYYALQPRPDAGHGELLFGGGPLHDDYGYYLWQPRLGTGRGQLFISPLSDGAVAVFDNSSNFVQQTVPGTERAADGIAGALRGRNLGAGFDGSGALAGAAYNNLGMVAEHLSRLLPLAGIGACSVAVNALAAGPGSPAVAFHLLLLLLTGLFLVILHVLRV